MKTAVKICGIKSLDEARAIIKVKNENLQYLGVIFAKSKRAVSMQTAREISHLAKQSGLKCVGVFASGGKCGVFGEFQSDCEIMEYCEYAVLDVAQIHGEISENLHANLKQMGLEIWQVKSVGKDDKLDIKNPLCDMVLYDTKGENLGGNGLSFEWNKLADLQPFSFAMAGGIGLENFKQALKFKPKLIDINSKVEDENLQKIPEKIAKILDF
ncbi:MAG: phosphoribosylanthranilate isomerase [Campylobacter sp.]|nr:phosphoribosylanthranilate isomerase [Campylobacter sp.]